MFPWILDQDLGSASWTWPSMPPCRQKLIDIKMFDPQSQYFKRGGHMPLMVFVGGHNQQRRTKVACERRHRRAEERGWGGQNKEEGRVGAVGMIGAVAVLTPVVTGLIGVGGRIGGVLGAAMTTRGVLGAAMARGMLGAAMTLTTGGVPGAAMTTGGLPGTA